jgi:uncharacterized protein YsxB (DUF464 family)
MINVQIYRNTAHEITGFAITGHANTAPHGKDIVCAGVAALGQTAVLGLEKQLKRDFELDVAEGKLILNLAASPDALTEAILETMLLGLTEIAKISPKSVHIAEHRR